MVVSLVRHKFGFIGYPLTYLFFCSVISSVANKEEASRCLAPGGGKGPKRQALDPWVGKALGGIRG
jgi:hypothetical protein